MNQFDEKHYRFPRTLNDHTGLSSRRKRHRVSWTEVMVWVWILTIILYLVGKI